MDRVNQPAPDREPGSDAADPNEFWSPQPSRVYSEQDAARVEGARKPTVDPITLADRLMEASAAPDASQQGHPFRIPEHDRQSTAGTVREENSAEDVPLHSGQGESGQPGEPPVILPNIGATPPNEVSVITLPVAKPRQGT